MNARDFLRNHILNESRTLFFGDRIDHEFVKFVVDAWMDDIGNSAHRFADIQRWIPGAKKILDMAAGCGTFMFYGLLHDYDMYGVEPEKWKLEFNRMKASENGYPLEWMHRFTRAVGERLPYVSDSFDCASSFQTLEHVRDPHACLCEMIRVTRRGGGVHIMCPDYRSTFEPHYRLPWLPLAPRPAARAYLRLRDRPLSGLDSIIYLTPARIMKALYRAAASEGKRITVLNCIRERIVRKLRGRNLAFLQIAYPAYRAMQTIRVLFRRELSVDILARVH